MKKLQVLTAAIYQRDFCLAEKMNLQCDAVIANQDDRNEKVSKTYPFGTVQLVTTKTRGVGVNRNIALRESKADILLFADEDVVYYDGMPKGVLSAFEKNKDADVMIFGMDFSKNGIIVEKRHLQRKRLHIWNSMKYGAVSIAARRSVLLRHKIMFSTLFGGGCIYSSGEDSLFLKRCFEKRLHIYSDPYVLGICSRDSSTWFAGCNEKYFYDKGALMEYLFPKLKYLMTLYFAVHIKKETEVSCKSRVHLMFAGLKRAKDMVSYEEYSKEKKRKYNEKNSHR